MEDKGEVRGKKRSWGLEDCTFFDFRDKIMNFGEEVQKHVNRRGQNDFAPGGTLRVSCTTITVFGLIQTLEEQ